MPPSSSRPAASDRGASRARRSRTCARRALAALAALALLACHAPRTFDRAESTAIVRAALDTLFLQREHWRQLVLWHGALRDGAALGELPAGDSLAAASIDVRALALPVPVRTVTLDELQAHFRAHPDAWAAWYRRFGSWDQVEPGRMSTILSYTDYIDWKTFIGDKLGEDLRDRPFLERKAALARLLRDAKAGILLNEHTCRLGAEGIVSKRVDGTYRSGPCRASR